MKVYFSATLTDDPETRKRYDYIINYIKEQGNEILQYGSHRITPQELINRSDTEIAEVYKELEKFIKNTDVYISDISEPSVGIGFEISQAVLQRKPVLVLNFEKSKFQPLATIEGLKSKYIKYKKYNLDNVKEVINEFLHDAKSKLDTKFILIISPEIDKYLEWASDQKRMHKAQIVRNAVEKMMDDDEEWRNDK